MAGINIRQKGQSGEREVCDWLNGIAYRALKDEETRIRLAARCPCGAGDAAVGQKRQPGHGLLAVKDLHAVQHDRLPAVQYGLYAVNRVGTHR